jgi:hypothetical protein
MIKLKVQRFLQDPGHCAIAASASLINFYDKTKDYEFTKKVALKKVSKTLSDGLDSGEMGILLNNIGFKKVTIISSNMGALDYSWDKLSRRKIIKNLKTTAPFLSDAEDKYFSQSICKWLEDFDYENKLIIDYNFADYIREYIDKGKPVIISFNWSMFFKFPKYNDKEVPDTINGEDEEHAVVVFGYNEKGVFICDSHHECYKYRLKRYQQGIYSIKWENLMTIIGSGDVFLADNYENKEE